MIIFADTAIGVRAISDQYIYQIIQSGKMLSIGYYYTATNDTDIINIRYTNEKAAVEAMRGYFKACKNNIGAYYFKGV